MKMENLQFKIWLESLLEPGVKLVYRSGKIHSNHILNFGTLEAAKKASVGRDIIKGYLTVNHPIEMKDSGWEHPENPHEIIKGILSIPGNWEKIKSKGWDKDSLINFFKRMELNHKALDDVRTLLINKGFDTIVYHNVNEDPG